MRMTWQTVISPADIFNSLVAMNVITDEPVFYVGEQMELFNMLLAFPI